MKRTLMLAAALFAGCRNNDMQVYKTAKTEPAPPVAAAPQPSEMEAAAKAHAQAGLPAAGGAPAAEGAGVKWTAPKGWVSKPASGMRLATFGVPTPQGEAELSVVVLAGDAGGNLANVNRWRGQLGLPATDEAGLKKISKAVGSKAGVALVVDIVGADGKSGMLGSILPKETQTWFFKLTGSAGAVKAAKPSTLDFLAGLR